MQNAASVLYACCMLCRILDA